MGDGNWRGEKGEEVGGTERKTESFFVWFHGRAAGAAKVVRTEGQTHDVALYVL